MLLAIAPGSVVHSSIAPRKSALALALVIFEFSLVLLAVLPLQFTNTVHFVF